MIHAITEEEWIRAGVVGVVATLLVTALLVTLLVGIAVVISLSL